MRLFLPTFLLIIVVLAVYPFIGTDDGEKPELTGLPWQIELQADGHTKVFGVVPGVSTLQDAATVLGDDYELAIVENASSVGLEMYFGNYRAGLMSAKMVLAAKSDATRLTQWKQNALKAEYMESGTAKKYLLAEADRSMAMQSGVDSIAFIPAVNLDDEIIRRRFGEPDEIITSADGVRHYLYQATGLSIALSDDAKEVLQYVAPKDFANLRNPLIQDQ